MMNPVPSPGPDLLTRDDTLIVIIDMQHRLVPVMAEKERLIENVVKLVKFSKIMNLPVVITEQQNLGHTIPQIQEELADVPPVIKLEFDCFRSKEFVNQVRRLNRSTLLLAGIEAHICVAQTALHGRGRYRIHVVSDAISSRAPHNHEIAVHRMGQAGVTITSTEMAMYEILEKAGTDTFRKVLTLVK
jgi:nicotinamidase-related amidase